MQARLSRVGAVVGTGTLVFCVVLGIRQLGWLQGFDLRVHDRFLRIANSAQADETQSADSSVVLVQVTEQDIQEQGIWPIPDRTLALALSRLVNAGAAVIGLDLYRDLPVPPGVDLFTRLLETEPRIVAVYKFGSADEVSISAPPALEGSGRGGFNDLLPDPGDKVVRRGLLYLDDGSGEVETSFALIVALMRLAAEGIGPQPDPDGSDWMRLGPHTLRPFEGNDGGYQNADNAGYQFLLDYGAPRGGFPTLRLADVLADEADLSVVRDRVVILGANAVSMRDLFRVPQGPPIPGMEVHAEIIDQLLRHGRGASAPVRFASEFEEISVILLASVLGCWLAVGLAGRPVFGTPALIAALIAGPALFYFAGAFAYGAGWWLPPVAPGVAWAGAVGVATAWTSTRERAQRDQLMRIFARHVSSDVASEIWRRRDDFFANGRPKPQRLTGTVLFLDIRGYTAQAERMEPEDLMEWINDFMDCMARQVAEHGGVVDDYFGDGLKANFGVPIARETEADIALDSQHAVACALSIESVLPALSKSFEARGLPSCAMRIGIHTGSLVAGSLGSADRLKYTVVGDNVVTAQRLEATDVVPHDYDAHPCRILISDDTHARLGDLFQTESVGKLQLKGKAEPVGAHRVLRHNDAPPTIRTRTS